MRTQKVWTPNGYTQGPINSLVGKGESIIDYTNGTGTLVTKGKKGVDNQPSSVEQNDNNVIAGNDVDWSNGIKFSDQVAPLTAKLQMYNNIEKRVKENKLDSLSKQTKQLQTTQIQQAKTPILGMMKNITDRQQMQHQIEDYNNYIKHNCGKDRFDKGKAPGKVPISWLNAGHAIAAGAEGLMLSRWLRENPIMPNIYAANRYAPLALSALNKLRVDPYNQLQAINNADRTAYYRIQQNGGYTGGQRQNARIALALGNARNIADVLNNTQLQNNKYRQNWASAALSEWNQDAARRQQASQYAWDAYNRAYGAKVKGIETHLSSLAARAQKYWADRIKNKQYEDTLGLYQQDIDNRKDAIKALLAGGQQSVVDNVGTQNNQAQQSTSGYTHSDNLNILNKYYHNTPLGDVFSIQNPYKIPQMDASMQKIPKGKYWMMPDQMLPKRYNSDQIRQAISGAQNTRQWAQNVLNQNEMNWGTIGDGNIYRDAHIYFNEPNNYIWQLRNKYPLAKVTYIPGVE